MSKFCDEIVVSDDNSIDDSVSIAKEFTNHVITHEKNQWLDFLERKQELLQYAISLGTEWVVWLDADEVFDRDGEEGGIRNLCNSEKIDAYSFLEYNLYKSLEKYRVDELWLKNWQPRLWKNTGRLKLDVKKGLHNVQHPPKLGNLMQSGIKCIHFGFSTQEKIDEKYNDYKIRGGMSGPMLERIRNEDGLILEDFDKEWFPKSVLLPSKI